MPKLHEYAWAIQPDSITVHTKDKGFTWAKDAPNFEIVKKAIREYANTEQIEALMDIKGTITKAVAGHGNVSVKSEGVYYKDKLIHDTLTERIMQHIRDQLPVEPLITFMDNLYKNARREAVLSLYSFLESNKIPLTPDGCFLAYKKVRDDYTDYHSGKFDNSPGASVEVEAWEVDPDRDNTCSSGLHVCSREYLPSYYGGQGKVVICKVNPAHVVAVPRDYNNSKMRVFKYEVIGELTEEAKAGIFDSTPLISPGDRTEHVNWHDSWGHDPDPAPYVEYVEEESDDECDDPHCDGTCDDPECYGEEEPDEPDYPDDPPDEPDQQPQQNVRPWWDWFK